MHFLRCSHLLRVTLTYLKRGVNSHDDPNILFCFAFRITNHRVLQPEGYEALWLPRRITFHLRRDAEAETASV
jgi:hypothetical protein